MRKTNLSNLHNLSKYFPPCMERIYNKIERTHHLKFYGRHQFIPFLKDIGLSLDEMMQYFNDHFLQVCIVHYLTYNHIVVFQNLDFAEYDRKRSES